jgi:DNA invertase Pin-like site-specific DNA recombinase
MGATLGYGRVSTSSGEQLSALDAQLAWLSERGCDLVLHDVESGLIVDRPSYSDLLKRVEAGGVSVLCATRADRLGRDGPELVRLVQLCDRAGVVVSTRDDGVLSAKTAEELLLLFVRAALAQGESMKISQRVRGGLEQGRRLGKPMRKPCWGYLLSRDRLRLEPDPVEFPRARRLVDHLVVHRWRLLPALSSFPEPVPLSSIRALRAWLLNPTVRGAIAYGQLPNHRFREILWDRHPAILGHDEFESYKRAAAANRRHWGANSRRRVRALTGLCVCDVCGHRLKYIPDRTHPGLRCNGDLCPVRYKSVREATLIAFAVDELQRGAADRLALAAGSVEPPEAVELRRQMDAALALEDPDLRPVIEAKAARLASILSAPQADAGLVERVADPRWWSVATYDEVTEILQATVREIRVAKQAPQAIRLRL